MWEPERRYVWMKRWLEIHPRTAYPYKIITVSSLVVINCYTGPYDMVPAQNQAMAISVFGHAGCPYFSRRL